MKKFYLTLLLAAFTLSGAVAQVSMDDVNAQGASFGNEMKTQSLDADYVSDAKLRADRLAKRKEHNTVDCIECGCCSYTCPSNLPLLDYIRIGKQTVMANIRARAAANKK